MQVDQAKAFILNKLSNDLPQHLTYHDVRHTHEVCQRVEELAGAEQVTEDDLQLLRTAAVFHDAGFLVDHADHESISLRLAREHLPTFGYTPQEIDRIGGLILATRIPQQPRDHLEQVLCDADLYYLGTEHYESHADSLYQEMHRTGQVKNRDEWARQQIHLLKTHTYFTPTACARLSQRQRENLDAIESRQRLHRSVTKHADFSLGDAVLIVAGVLMAALALKGFLVPNNFFDGGVTGISLLVHEIFGYNLGYVIVLANLPFIVMGLYSINFHFAVKTLVCIALLGICLLWLPYPVVTSDKLLISIFGGFFLGVGIGLTMRAGCAVDGIEVLALYTWRRTSFTISEIILALNIIIFSIAAFRFGIQTSLYSMLTYFTASKTIDYVVEGIEAYTGVTIISGRSEIIKDKLVNELGRGITIYKGERGFLPGAFHVHDDVDIIFTVITRLELRKLKNLVSDVDPNAFVFANTIKEASGGVMKRRHVH